MPGETTQRIVACSSDRDHEPHPVVGVAIDGGEDGWCPGVPRRHPDGSLVAPEPVPFAGDLRTLTEEVQAAQADIAARESAAGEPAAPRDSTRLQAEEYAVTVSGIPCRVSRRTATGDVFERRSPAPAWWEVGIGRAYAHETTVTDPAKALAETRTVHTTARFAFNPEDLDSEQIALDRAGSYCEQVAHALAQLWREQARTYDTVTEAVARARVVCGALPDE